MLKRGEPCQGDGLHCVLIGILWVIEGNNEALSVINAVILEPFNVRKYVSSCGS